MQNLEINFGVVTQRNCCQGKMIAELIKKALVNKQLTRPQANALLRHKKHHTEGHLLFMMKLMIEKHLTFGEAHQRALKAVGK